jgi:hypothetical protein
MFKVEDSPAPIGEHDPRASDGVRKSYGAHDENGSPPWSSWPSPPGGFIDLGYVSAVEKRVLRILIV